MKRINKEKIQDAILAGAYEVMFYRVAQAQLDADREEVKEICEFLILQKTNLVDVQKIADGSYKQALKQKHLGEV